MKLIEELNDFLDNQNFNGTILISQNNEIILSKGYGYACFEHKIENKPNTVMRIASITKQFTAACILKLVEEKRINLKDKLSKYLPDFNSSDIITIHHLLSNSSGIANFDIEMDFYPFINSDSVLLSLIDFIKDKPLMFEPGSKFFYSISGYLVLQYIIEKVSGCDYETFLRENFLDKLEMFDTGFDFPNRVVENKAFGYKLTESKIELADFIDMRIAGGGGALYSTVLDLFKWNNSLQNHLVLKADTIDLMYQSHTIADSVNSYGYGIIIAKGEINGKERVKYYHPGGGNGVRSFNTYYPQLNTQVILLSNVEDKITFEAVRTGIDKIILK